MARDRNQLQRQIILRYLKKHGKITPFDALREAGSLRLAARIADLRKEGYKIDTVMVSRKNSAGYKVHFAEYRLEESNEAD